MRRPAFRAHLRVHVVAPDLLVVVAPERSCVFEGRLLPLLVPHLDGHTTREQLIESLIGAASPLDVDYGLHLLDEQDLLTDGDLVCEVGRERAPGLVLLPRQERLGAEARTHLREARIAVRCVGDGSAALGAELRRALGEAGFAGEGDGEPRLTVAVADTLDASFLELATGENHRATPIVPLRSSATRALLGPVLVAGGPCLRCLERRLRENRATAILAASVAVPVLDTTVEIAGFRERVAGLAATEIARWALASDASPLADGVRAFDAFEPEASTHPAPLCGCAIRSPAERLDERIDRGRPARRRRADAGRLYRRLRPLVDGVTGVADRLEPAGRFDDWEAHTWFVEHSFAPAEPRVDDLRESFRHASAGRGATPEQARTAALCEALERYSGLFRGDEVRLEATLDELGEAAIHPNACMGFSDRQSAERERWNRPRHRYCWVPVPLESDRLLEWSPVHSMSERRTRYLPTAFLYYRYPLDESRRCCFADSNGTAAGATLEEAILHGLLELVERDCAAMWWYQRIPRPPVAEEALSDGVRSLRERYAALGRSLEVLDLTNDLGLPACAAVSFLHEGRAQPGELLVGFGCDLDPQDAATAAVTELHQFLPAAVGGSLRPRFSSPPGPEPFLLPDPEAPPPPAAFSSSGDAPLDSTLDRVLEVLSRHRLDLLVLDQTRGDVGLPVAKTLVPGLRHFWPRLGPGRLYEVPVRLGWVAEAPRETQLNPIQLLI